MILETIQGEKLLVAEVKGEARTSKVVGEFQLLAELRTIQHCSPKRPVFGLLVIPVNKGHLGTQAAVPYSEVVPYWEVRDKTVILCTFTASMMYKTHYGVIE